MVWKKGQNDPYWNFPKTTLISKRSKCFGFDAPSTSGVAIGDNGWVMWKQKPRTSCINKNIIAHFKRGSITEQIIEEAYISPKHSEFIVEENFYDVEVHFIFENH